MILKALIGCEESGVVRNAFRELGHDAWSCDLQKCSDGSEFHYQMDVFEAIKLQDWDIGIFHPPCFIGETLILTKHGKHITHNNNIENINGVELLSKELSIKITMIDKENYCWAS